MKSSLNSVEFPNQQEAPQESRPFLVGVGGWAYLPLKSANKLEVCARLYDFVEVNSTFYDFPKLDQVKRWRKAVPEKFEFTVRANKQLTHLSHLEPSVRNYRMLERMIEICDELHSQILHFQFPPSLKVTENVVLQWDNFFSSASAKRSRGLHYAIEARSAQSELTSSAAFRKLQDKYDLILTEDASRSDEISASPSGILYTRVFGHGEHTKWTFDSSELSDLSEKVQKTPARKKYVTFHNMTMYEDASRMKTVAKSGSDRNVSPGLPTGLNSLKRAISSGRLSYPATKQYLISEFGWKTFDAETSKREHVSKALAKLTESKKYSSPEEVVQELLSKE